MIFVKLACFDNFIMSFDEPQHSCRSKLGIIGRATNWLIISEPFVSDRRKVLADVDSIGMHIQYLLWSPRLYGLTGSISNGSTDDHPLNLVFGKHYDGSLCSFKHFK